MRNLASGKNIIISLIVASLFFPWAAAAQEETTPFSLMDVGSVTGLGGGDLRSTSIKTIQFVLGFMTLLAVVFMIYAGFIWLTAAGNEKNVEKAKSIISATVIGMIVIILAWAIVAYVASTASNVTKTTTG